LTEKRDKRPGSEYIRRQTEASRRDWEQTRATGIAPVDPAGALARGRAGGLALGLEWLIRTWPGRTVLVTYVVGLGLVFVSRAFSDGTRDTVQSFGGTLVVLGIVIGGIAIALGGLALLLPCSARAGAPRRQVYEGGAIAALLVFVSVGLIAR
jgi:hypothetical protein